MFKLTIAYEGTQYHGWQIQPGRISIQETIENALHTITREKIRIVGAGRTDSGVHALGQVAHFSTSREIDSFKLQGSLNGLLPSDIRILHVEIVDDAFHAQYSAKSKIYRYYLYTDRVLNPFQKNYVWHVFYPLDLQLLKQATRCFIGTHDFTSFANEAHLGVASYDPVRCMQRIEVIPTAQGVMLEFEADGFLYKMVRNIVGVLVECAMGKKRVSTISDILKAKDRRKAGYAAPPQGLFLVSVNYSQHVLQIEKQTHSPLVF